MFALLVPALVGALVAAVGSMVGRAIMAAGIGFVTYKGIDLAINQFREVVMANMSGIPADVAGMLGFFWFDRALTIVFSAVNAALALRMLKGAVKKVVLK